MKLQILRALCLCVAFALNAAAADGEKERSPLEGTWRWKFTMPDGGTITPQVKFTAKDDALAGISLFRAGSEAPVTNIKQAGNQVSFEVVRERDGGKIITQYRGALNGDILKGTVTTKSNGEEQSYDWEARRASNIEGIWKWSVNLGNRPVESRLTVKADGDNFTGKITAGGGFGGFGGRGGRGGGAPPPPPATDVHNITFKDDLLTFETERPGRDGIKYTNVYSGKLTGDKITGTSILPGSAGTRTNEWIATRTN